jgi:hypothetical protein
LKCKIENCENEVRTKGYCNKHYSYAKRSSLIDDGSLVKCKIEGCENLEYAREMCHQHYRYHLRKGLIDFDEVKLCKVVGCNEKVRAKHYCNRHYIQLRVYGKILERTLKDLNEIIIHDDFAEIILYNKDNIEVAQALIDVDDVDKVKDFKWGINGWNYVVNMNNNLKLHNLIMNNYDDNMIIDHIDHNPLNNMKYNLRHATSQENSFNVSKRNNPTSSKYKGVTYRKDNDTWRARITINAELINLGQFESEEEAAKTYDKKAKELFGEFACLNFPEE